MSDTLRGLINACAALGYDYEFRSQFRFRQLRHQDHIHVDHNEIIMVAGFKQKYYEDKLLEKLAESGTVVALRTYLATDVETKRNLGISTFIMETRQESRDAISNLSGFYMGFEQYLFCQRIQPFKNLMVTCRARGESRTDLMTELGKIVYGECSPHVITNFELVRGGRGLVVVSFNSFIESNISLLLLRNTKSRMFGGIVDADFLQRQPLLQHIQDGADGV